MGEAMSRELLLLEEGDVIALLKGQQVYACVPLHFLYDNRKGNWKVEHGGPVTIEGELSYLAGEYVVYKTSEDGGGPCSDGSSYPSGHHVFCERASDRARVDFYQTGFFTAMITNIDPIGKAERKWVKS